MHDAVNSIAWSDVRKRLGLSGREIDIARLLCLGRKAASMARPLKITTNTVKTHLRRLFKKCGVHDRASFVTLIFCTAQQGSG